MTLAALAALMMIVITDAPDVVVVVVVSANTGAIDMMTPVAAAIEAEPILYRLIFGKLFPPGELRLNSLETPER
ncbi:MAG: hypothetical protein PVS2B1_15090 [Candidatus Dormibacteraceae bacterium]